MGAVLLTAKNKTYLCLVCGFLVIYSYEDGNLKIYLFLLFFLIFIIWCLDHDLNIDNDFFTIGLILKS